MARTSFGRTIIETICDVRYIDENNAIKSTEIVLYGDYNIKTSQNAVRNRMQNNRAVVKSLRHVSYYATMPVEDFAKLATEKPNTRKEW